MKGFLFFSENPILRPLRRFRPRVAGLGLPETRGETALYCLTSPGGLGFTLRAVLGAGAGRHQAKKNPSLMMRDGQPGVFPVQAARAAGVLAKTPDAPTGPGVAYGST